MTTYGSLFTGVGGLDLAVSRVFGASPVWHSEIDENPAKVLAHHYPEVPNLGDITKIDWSEVERPDIICGGYPCQPFSLAGQRKGEADARHLWPFVRDAVAALRPDYLVLENVRGHLSLGFGSVLRDLSAIGYDAEWSCFKASAVGAPHQRDRLWVVATPSNPDSTAGRPSRGAGEAVHEPGEVERSGRCCGMAGQGTQTAPDPHSTGLEGWPTVPQRGNQQPSRSDSLEVATDTSGERHREHPGGAPTEEAREEVRHLSDDHGGVRTATDWGPFTQAVEHWGSIIGRPAPSPTDERGRLSPQLPEWMMGYPEGWVTDHLPRSPAIKAAGNAVCPQQAEAAIRGLLEGSND